VSKNENLIFVNKAIMVHGHTYGYEPTDYKDSKTKVKIRCYIHGIFEQTPNNHLRGQGCPSCYIVKREKDKEKQRIINEEKFKKN